VFPAAEPVPPADSVGALIDEALRRLAGSAQVRCAERPDAPVSFEIDEWSIRFAGSSLPIASVHGLDLAARSDGTLEVGLGSRSRDREVLFTLDDAGRLAGMIARLPDTQGAPAAWQCAPQEPARWGGYDGQARRFVDGIDKPRPWYPPVDMRCSASFPYGETLRVRYDDHVLSFESVAGGFAMGRWLWLDPNLHPTPPTLMQLGLIRDGSIRYGRLSHDDGRSLDDSTASITTDGAAELVAANSGSRPWYADCSR
jgi:hypothetical protein